MEKIKIIQEGFCIEKTKRMQGGFYIDSIRADREEPIYRKLGTGR
jgi:hypothetical protein